MKLHAIEHREAYGFRLTFENGAVRDVDLKRLIGRYVPIEQLSTARIDPEWGCLEFLDGKVDISPRTLYQFVFGEENRRAA